MNVNGGYLLAKVIRRLQWMSQHSVQTTGFCFEKTHYETMNLNRMCTNKDIREAFITLSKKYHPDRNQNDPKNHARFVALNEAYSVLSKPEKRRHYDMTLGMANQSSTSYRQTSSYNEYYKSGFPQYAEYAQRGEKYRAYRYDVRNSGTSHSSQRRIPLVKVLIFILSFTMVGAAVQYLIVKWMFHITQKRQMDIHNEATAAYQALQEEVSKRTHEENYRALIERYNARMQERNKRQSEKE